MARTVEILEYDPAWPDAFEKEVQAINRALPGLAAQVLHIGSTAVPGMPAKPIIDMLLVAERLDRLVPFDTELQRIGYAALREFGIPDRRFYVKGGDERTHHLHAFESRSPEIGRHRKFRDFLRESSETATAYAALKRTLAERYKNDPHGYNEAKGGFIRSIDARIGGVSPNRRFFRHG